MIRRLKVISLLLVCSLPLKAQSGFFFGVDAASANTWTGLGIQLVEGITNHFLKEAYDDWEVTPAIGGRLTYDIMNFRDDGTKVMFNPDDWWGFRRLFGFRKKDLFGHLVGNVKFGWMGAYSPIGVYLHAGYDYRNFGMQLSYQTEAEDYSVGTFNPGIGIRISPSNFYHSQGIKFILEVGTNYNIRSYYRGPYNNDKSQLNNALSYSVALGISDKYTAILLGFEWGSKDLFNREYTPDNGLFFPYYNLSSKIMSVYLSVNYGF